jgi:hypothetical protein
MSRLTPSEAEAVRFEYGVDRSRSGFAERAKRAVPSLTDAAVAVLKAEFDSGRTAFARRVR